MIKLSGKFHSGSCRNLKLGIQADNHILRLSMMPKKTSSSKSQVRNNQCHPSPHGGQQTYNHARKLKLNVPPDSYISRWYMTSGNLGVNWGCFHLLKLKKISVHKKSKFSFQTKPKLWWSSIYNLFTFWLFWIGFNQYFNLIKNNLNPIFSWAMFVTTCFFNNSNVWFKRSTLYFVAASVTLAKKYTKYDTSKLSPLLCTLLVWASN